MSEKKDDFKEKAAQSALHKELSDTKRQIAEINRAYRRLCFYTINLIYKSQLKDQRIDDLYCRMYGLAEMPKRKKDREKIRRTLQMIEKRPRNRQNDFLPPMDLLDTNMLPMINTSRPRTKRGGRTDPFGYGGCRYDDPWADLWQDEQDVRYDGDEYEYE